MKFLMMCAKIVAGIIAFLLAMCVLILIVQFFKVF